MPVPPKGMQMWTPRTEMDSKKVTNTPAGLLKQLYGGVELSEKVGQGQPGRDRTDIDKPHLG